MKHYLIYFGMFDSFLEAESSSINELEALIPECYDSHHEGYRIMDEIEYLEYSTRKKRQGLRDSTPKEPSKLCQIIGIV